MRIYPSNLNWRGTLTPITRKIEKIICHHPAGPGTMEANHNYHRNTLGWNGLGYDFWIDYDGKIYEVRGRHVGAHSGANWNGRSYGPCWRGNFENQKMTDEQLASGIWLLAKLCREEGLTEKDIAGHRDVATSGTLCPGKNFRMKELKDGVAKLLASGDASAHIVKKDDTLHGIASTYGLTLKEIVAANPQIKDPNRIFPGDEINIPEKIAADDKDKIIEQLKAQNTELKENILKISMEFSQLETRKEELEMGMKQAVSILNNLVR